MYDTLNFIFREKLFTCDISIADAEDPALIFVILNDPGLITEFGDEIVVKTDFISRLSKRDDYGALTLLRQAIFESLSYHPAFVEAKTKKLLSGRLWSASFMG